MLVHAMAHGDVRTHVRESALKVDSGRQIPCRTGESNQLSAACLFDALPTELHFDPDCHTTVPTSGSGQQHNSLLRAIFTRETQHSRVTNEALQLGDSLTIWQWFFATGGCHGGSDDDAVWTQLTRGLVTGEGIHDFNVSFYGVVPKRLLTSLGSL